MTDFEPHNFTPTPVVDRNGTPVDNQVCGHLKPDPDGITTWMCCSPPDHPVHNATPAVPPQ